MTNFDDIADLTAITSPYTSTLIQGQVSTGKSYLAATIATAEKPAIYFSFDKPDAGLQNHPNVANLKFFNYFDPPVTAGMPPRPTAFDQFLLDVGLLEYKKKSGKLREYYYILDSLKFCEMSALRRALYESKSARASVKLGGSEIYVPNGWEGYVNSSIYINSILNRLFFLGDTIVTAHERPEEDATSKDKDKRMRLTGKLSLDPPRLDQFKSQFLNKYRVSTLGIGRWVVHTRPNEDFDGGCVLHPSILDMEEANLSSLLRKDALARGNAVKAEAPLQSSK